MHPIEHLRYVARARHIDAADLVRESAVAFGSLREDGPSLVIACRRIVERHPEVGPLWWMSARMLTSDDPRTMAWQVADEIECDTTADVVADRLPDSATVVTIGRPATIEEALVRRGDLRVWCADAGLGASGLMQRLERADVECEPISPEALARAVAAADLVLVEAIAAARVGCWHRSGRMCWPPSPVTPARRCGASPGSARACPPSTSTRSRAGCCPRASGRRSSTSRSTTWRRG